MKNLKWLALGTVVTSIATYCICKLHHRKPKEGQPFVRRKEVPIKERESNKPNNAPQMVERSKNTVKRLQRNDKFKEFYAKAKDIFEPLGRNDKNAEDYRNFKMLCVCAGSRAGGQEHDIVEVFWGSRYMESDEKVTLGGMRFEAKYEYGATMMFTKQENGYVSVYLQPSHINFKKPEACIVWKKSIDPAKLLKLWYQKYLWSGFMAYMEVTSTDGNPSMWQRFRIYILRLIRPIIEGVTKPYPYTDKEGIVRVTEITENIERPIKLVQGFPTVLKWVFQVSLSGVLLFLIPIFFPKESDETKELKCLEKGIDTVSINIKQKNVDLRSIENKLDSINLSIQKKLNSANKRK